MRQFASDSIWTRLQALWELIINPADLEKDPEFRNSLREVMYLGLRWGGAAVCLGGLLHVAVEVLGRGKSIVWIYSASGGQTIAVAYHMIVGAAGAGLVALAERGASLRAGRLAVAATVLMTCSFSIHDDLLRGASISIGFVVILYAAILVIVPFRPWQALLLGGGILGGYWLLAGKGVLLPAEAAVPPQFARQVSELGVAVLFGTAMSTTLYATRLAHHQIRRAAERELEQARTDAERARAEAEQARGEVEDALAIVQEQAEQLRQLDEMKSRFFANVSHELRTPVSLMNGPIQQLLEKDDRPEDEREILEIADRNAERLERLVEQLMDLARHDAERLSLSVTRREWGPFVERTVQRFAPMAETQNVSLSVTTDDAGVPVVFDPDYMETVVGNLVRNALTYTPAEGTVTVTAAVEEETAVLSVEDTGPGIPEEKHDALFDRFHRGAGLVQERGTGIGLSLTQALVALHEGDIEVKSTPGEGSRFLVEWPATLPVDEEAQQTDRPEAEERSEASSRTKRGKSASDEEEGRFSSPEAIAPDAPVDRTTMLIVEDNADVRQYVRQLFEPRYWVREAKNGVDGLEQARTVLPDLIVADVMMPGMDGFAMLRELRQSPRTESIPVVMLTARAEEADQVEGLEGGAEAYVTKPFAPDVLRAQVDRLIASYRQHQEEAPPVAPTDTDVDEPTSFDEQVRAVISARLSDPSFSVEELSEAVGLTRRTVTRKVKAAFDQTPSALIRTMRVERGAELLPEESRTITEVAYAVGFNSLSHFSRTFREHFGLSPSAYRTKHT